MYIQVPQTMLATQDLANDFTQYASMCSCSTLAKQRNFPWCEYKQNQITCNIYGLSVAYVYSSPNIKYTMELNVYDPNKDNLCLVAQCRRGYET